MQITFTGTDDLLALQRDLERTAEVAPEQARAVIAKGALNIKKDAQRRWSGMPHLRRLPAAVTYDTHETPSGGWAEIGPDKNKPQGALGNIAEYGSVKNAPIPALGPAAELEEPRTARYLEDLAYRSLEGL